MDFAPQIETREIAEDELDAVSGGLGVGGVNLAPVTEVSHLADVAAPITNTVTGLTSKI